jgi:hypothetical protein
MTRHEAFPLAVVLHVYHNKPFSSIKEMRELLNYMTGTDVPLWEVPRARVICAKYLERHFPWLPEIDMAAEFRSDQANKFVRKVATDLGRNTVAVPPIRKGVFVPLALSHNLSQR